MHPILIYILILSAVAGLAQLIAEATLGISAASVVAIAVIYVATIFDLKMASPRWSMFRRILPNVSWFDCAVYALPFIYMIGITSGAVPGADSMISFIIAMPIYFLFGIYFLFRWQHMRKGSHDDLSWVTSSNLTIGERAQRYLGERATDTP